MYCYQPKLHYQKIPSSKLWMIYYRFGRRSKPGNVIDTKFRDHESQVYPRLRTVLIGTRLYVYRTHHRTHLIECTSIPRARNATRITFPEVIPPSCSTEYCTAGEFHWASGRYIRRPNSQIKTFISSCLHPDEIYSIREPEIISLPERTVPNSYLTW